MKIYGEANLGASGYTHQTNMNLSSMLPSIAGLEESCVFENDSIYKNKKIAYVV